MNHAFFSFLYSVVCFSNVSCLCLIFYAADGQGEENNCDLHYGRNEGYSMCLRCNLSQSAVLSERIALDSRCSPLGQLHCFELLFEDAPTFETFAGRHAQLINQVFDVTHGRQKNSVFVNIANGAIDRLSLRFIEPLQNVPDRRYPRLTITLNNRDVRQPLILDPDIQRSTFDGLQLNIFCGAQGLYQYNYEPKPSGSPPMDNLKCEIPPPEPSTERTSDRPVVVQTTARVTTLSSPQTPSNKKRAYRVALTITAIGFASLLPCILLACCLYVLYRPKDVPDDTKTIEPRASRTFSGTESVWSDASPSAR